MSPTERIAQTFPDIDSQGLNTSGTAAGVRSFPQPFVGVASGGVDILIQNGVVNIPLLSRSTFTAIPTSVEVSRSFIQYRGCNVLASSTFITTWRNRINFRAIVGGFSSSIRARRNVSGNDVVPTGGPGSSALDVYFTVVTFLGANTDSADIRIENCDFPTIVAPSTSGTCILAGPQLTAAELLRCLVFVRGLEFFRVPGGPSACRAGTGTECVKHVEQAHGTLNLVNSGGNTELRFSRFTAGNTILPNHCGTSNLDVSATVVIFP